MHPDQITELASAATTLSLLEQRVHALETFAADGTASATPAARTAGFETIMRNGRPVRVFRAPQGVHEGGQFSKPTASWAKALAMWVIRGLVARDYIKNNDGQEGYLLPKGKALAELGIPEGTPVRVRYHDSEFGLIDVFDRGRNAVTPTKVSWDRFLDDLPDVRDESTLGRATLPDIDPGPDGTARARRLNEITGYDRNDPPAFDITTPPTAIPFNGGDFRHANLAGVDLRDRYAMGADFTGAFMVRSNLADTRLADANFEGATVQGANLAGADLTGAKLTHSRFDFAKARGADFRGAEANFANLSYADLRDTTWDGNLRYANLASADLRGADLSAVTELPQAEHLLSGARYDQTTRFPDGYTPPAYMVNDSKGADTAPEFQLQHDLTQWSLFDQPSPPYDPAAAQEHAVPYTPSTVDLTRRLADGGFTLDPSTGEFPTHGVAVGIPPHTVRMTRDHFDQHGEAEIADFLDRLAESGAQPLEGGTFAVGGWYDQSTGDVVLDAVEVFTNDSHGDNYLGAGVRAGVVRNQEGVYHLDQNNYIPTGGDGGRNTDQVRGLGDGTRRRDSVEAPGGDDPRRAPDAGEGDLPGDQGDAAELTPPTAGGDGDSLPPAGGGTTVGLAEPPDRQPITPDWVTDPPEPDVTNVAKALDANGFVQANRGAAPEPGQYALRRSRTKVPGTVVVPGTGTDTGRIVDVLNGVGFDAKAEPTGRVRVRKGLGQELAKGANRLAGKVIADILTPGGDSLIRDVLPGEVNTATRLVPDVVPEPDAAVNGPDQLAQQVADEAAQQLTEEPPADDSRPDIWDLSNPKITKTAQPDGTVAVSIGGVAAGTLRPDARYPGQWLPYDSNGEIPKLTYKDAPAPSRNQPQALKYLVDRFMADRRAARARGEDVPPLRPNLVVDRQSTDTYTVAAGSKYQSVPLGRVRKVGKDKRGGTRWEATTPDGRTVDTGTPFRTRAMAEDALIRAYDDPSVITGTPTAPEPDDGTVKVPWSTSKPKVTTANVNKLLTANGLEQHWRPNGEGTFTTYPQSRDLEGKTVSTSVYLRAGDAATADRIIEIATAAGFQAERMGDSTRPDAMLQISRPRVQVPAPEWVRTAMGNATVDTPYSVGSDGDSTYVRFETPPTPAELTEASTALGIGGYNTEQGTDETGATVLWVTPGTEPLGSAATPAGFEKVQATRLAPGDTFIPSTPEPLDEVAANYEADAVDYENAGDTSQAQTRRNMAARIRGEIADGFTHRVPTTITKGTEQPYTVKSVTKSPSGVKGTPNLRVETTTGEVFNMTARQRVLLPGSPTDTPDPADTVDAPAAPMTADQIVETIDDSRRRVPGSPGFRPTETGDKTRVLSSPVGEARFVEGARRPDKTYEPDTIKVPKHFNDGTTKGLRDVGSLNIGSASSTTAPTLTVGGETIMSPVPASDPAGVRRWAYTQLAERGFLDGTDGTPGSKTKPALSPSSKAEPFLTADQTDRLAAYYSEFGGGVYDSTIADRPDVLALAGEALDLFRDRYTSPVVKMLASRYPADRSDRALPPQAAATVLNNTANLFREARALGVTDTPDTPDATSDTSVTPVQFKVVLPGGIEGRTVRDGFLTADGTEIVDENGNNLAPVDQARILSEGDPLPALPGATDVAPAPEPAPEPTPEPAAPDAPAAPEYTGGARQVTRRGQTFDVAEDGTVTRDGKRVARTTANLVREQAQNEAGAPSPTPSETPSTLDKFDVAPDGTVTLNGNKISGQIADNARRRAQETGRWTPPTDTPAPEPAAPDVAPPPMSDQIGDATSAAIDPAAPDLTPFETATVETPAEPETPPKVEPLPSGKFPPTAEQLDALAKFATGESMVVEAGAGAGKALRDDQPVLTDHGWVPISDIQIGDRVAGTDGFGEVTGVFPQGVRDTVEVVLSDGQVIVCDWDHLWDTQTEQERKRGVFSTKTTREIADTIRARGGTRKQHYLPSVQPVKFPEADLPVDPWLLGYLLGNGGISSGRNVTVSSADDWALDAVRASLPDPCGLHHNSRYDWRVNGVVPNDNVRGRVSNPLHDALRELGLWELRDEAKFIPEPYLFASIDQRRALLAGLLDADGYAEGRNCEIFTVSPRLAAGIRELCNSLGWTATGTPKTPTFTYRGERRTGQPGTRFYITPARGENPFTMPRKRDAFTPRSKYPARRCIVEIREAGPASCTCISVDTADRLYLTAGYTPTHNTSSLVLLANQAKAAGRRGLFTAFNKLIVQDAGGKLPNNIQAQTMHSVAYRALLPNNPWIADRLRAKALKRREEAQILGVDRTNLTEDLSVSGTRIAAWVMMGVDRFAQSGDRQPTAEHLGELPGVTFAVPEEVWSRFVDTHVATMRRAWADLTNPNGRLRFKHGHYLKMFDLSDPDLGYDFVMMDEAQDTAPVMESILRKQMTAGRGGKGTQLVAVGDSAQCQPAGTLVSVVDSGYQRGQPTRFREVPIEMIRPGDQVVSFDTSKSFLRRTGRTVTAVAARPYDGEMLTVRTGGLVSQYTPNHKCVARMGGFLADKWIVYMMRRGTSYRIGMTRGETRGDNAFRLPYRMACENADAAWILDTFDTEIEARVAEATTAWIYGIPSLRFVQKMKTGVSQGELDTFWAKVGDLTDKAAICLRAHHRMIEYPLMTAEKRTLKRRSSIIHACNLMDGMFVLPFDGAITAAGKQVAQKRWEPITVERGWHTGPVYSLEVEADETYIADGIVTHNSINGFTGAVDALMHLKEVDGVEEASLTQSFRFGPEVAQLANNVLSWFTPFRIAGSGGPSSVGDVPDPDAILTRTNGAAMAEAIEALNSGKAVGMSENLKTALTSFSEGARDLMANGFTEQPDLAPFDNWDEVLRFVEEDPAGQDIKTLVGLVDSYGPDNMLDILSRVGKPNSGDVTILTAHTSKGLEFPTVRLADDFPKLRDKEGNLALGPDDFMLMYVALTRAKKRLDPGANDWILEPAEGETANPAPIRRGTGDGLSPDLRSWLDDYLATPDTNAADGFVPVPDTVVAPYKTVEPVIGRRGANTWMRKVTGPGSGPGKLGGRDDKANFEYLNGDHLFTVDKVTGGWTVVPNLPGGEDALYQVQTATGSRNGEVKIRQWIGVVDGVPHLYDEQALIAADRAGLDWSNPANLTPTDPTVDVADIPLTPTAAEPPTVADIPLVDATPTPDATSPAPATPEAAPPTPAAGPQYTGPYAEFLTAFPDKLTDGNIAANPRLRRLAADVLQAMASEGALEGYLADVYSTADRALQRAQRTWDSEASYDRRGDAVDFDEQGARPDRITLTPGQARGVLNSARRWMKSKATPNEPAPVVDDTGTGVPSSPDVPAHVVAEGLDDVPPPAGWPEARDTAPWTAEQTWAGVSLHNPELSADQIRNGTLVMGYTHGPQDASGRATVQAIPGITKGDDFYPAAAPASLRMAPRFGGPAGLAKWFATEKVGGRSAAKNSPLTPTDLTDLRQVRTVGETLGSAPAGGAVPLSWVKTRASGLPDNNLTGAEYTAGPWKVERVYPASTSARSSWTLTHSDQPFINQEYPTLQAAKEAAGRFESEGADLVNAREKVRYYEDAAASGGIVDSPEEDARALAQAQAEVARIESATETLGSAPAGDGPTFHDYIPAQEIDAAIDSYPAQIRQEGVGTQGPYDAASLAEIYSPRVRQLMDLQAQGFTHARWGWDPDKGQNRWFGVTPESPEARNEPLGSAPVIDGDAEMMARYEADMAADSPPEGGWAAVPLAERPVSVLLGTSYDAEDIRRLLRMSGLSATQRSELRDLLDAMTGGRTAAVNHPEPTMGDEGDVPVNHQPLDDMYPGGATLVADRRPGTTTPTGDAHTAALTPTGDATVLLIDGEPAAEWAPGVTPTGDEVAAVTATLGWQLNGADSATTWELTPAPPAERCRTAGMTPTWLVAADNYLSRIGVHRGDAVQVAYLDDEHGEIDVTNPDGSVAGYPVKWARFASAAPHPGVRTVHDPHFVGNDTAARSGNGQSTAERVRVAGVGYATVADKYLNRYGIEQGDTVPVRWLDDTTAVVEAVDGSTIHAAWARFTDADPADLNLDDAEYVGGSVFDELPVGARFAVEALGAPVRTPEGRVAALVKSDAGTYSLADNPAVAWRWDPITGAHLRLLVAADHHDDEEV